MKTSKLILSLAIAAAATGSSLAAPKQADATSSANRTIISASQANNPYEVAGIDNPAEFHDFFLKLQRAVKKNDKKAVASMMHYPLNVNTGGKTYKFWTPERFIAKYDAIMTTKVRKTLGYAIEDDLFVSWKGVSVGDGALWISQFNGEIAVYGVNK
ncbi:hypothetical protein [Saccharibacillus kuerlensis]|uniref:Uncharacterized protein n=1 Tax=Saccharibacillus kuerlensis TaxID=459527 RepID=A0ABQ2L4A1_9BACL|nr:hypothetical protein [Saccharibacillus kuerlensis]GGO02209.1 hypothetical protein GCM10010969_25310 [Saccharibacillus kuerlensis]